MRSKDLASKGELIILVGGSREALQKYVKKLLKKLGKTVIYLGADSNGHKMKLAINLHLGLLESHFPKLSFSRKSFD